jgi:hypothetical protein
MKLIRYLLLLLVLANVFYFLWGWMSRDQREPGVAVLDESELGPPLSMAQKPTPGEGGSVGAVLGEGATSELVAVVGRSCVSVGPFAERNEAEAAQARYAAGNMTARVRSTFGDVFVGHWVQVRDVPDLETSRQMITTLHEGGLTDAYPIETDDEGRKISLGVFGNRERAERVAADARALGLDAEITQRTTQGTVYWTDLALPPGRGATEIVELYGEERVLLRNEATCPAE